MRQTLLLAVADDGSRRQLFEGLSKEMFFVVEATSNIQAIDRIKCFNPDVIYLDLSTMKENLDTCKKIRRECRNRIILSVTNLDETTKTQGQEMKIQNLIQKPIEEENLYSLIKSVALGQLHYRCKSR